MGTTYASCQSLNAVAAIQWIKKVIDIAKDCVPSMLDPVLGARTELPKLLQQLLAGLCWIWYSVEKLSIEVQDALESTLNDKF